MIANINVQTMLSAPRPLRNTSPDKIMARYNRTTLEEVFLDVARGRAQEPTP